MIIHWQILSIKSSSGVGNKIKSGGKGAQVDIREILTNKKKIANKKQTNKIMSLPKKLGLEFLLIHLTKRI